MKLTKLALLLAIAGCAAPGKDMMETRATCTSSPCALTVDIRDCGNVKTSPNRLDIPPGNSNDIVWTIVTPGWTFARNGIEFKSGSGAGLTPVGGSGTTSFRYRNNHSPGTHAYNVNVMQSGSSTVCTEDPTIVNH